MEVSKCLEELFKKLGEQTVVKTGEEAKLVYAFIQPMRYKNKLYLDMKNTEVGFNDTECFLYLGPAEADFTNQEMQTVIYPYMGDRAYNVSRADRISIGGEILYIWAVLTPRIKEEQYDTL